MPDSYQVRKLVNRLASLSKKTFDKYNPVVLATVLSRNPDGSLNVDDGKGGCQRVAPAANVRVGQKVPLGVEPGIGEQTSLPNQSVDIEPSSVPCPTDDPDTPTPCPPGIICTEEVEFTADLDADLYSILWFDFCPPTFAEIADGLWENRLAVGEGTLRGGPIRGCFDTESLAGTISNLTSRRSGDYGSTADGDAPYADEVTVNCRRVFASFDTSDVGTGVITAATLRLVIFSNELPYVQDDFRDRLLVVPSDHNGDLTDQTNFDKVFEDAVLAEITLQEIVDAGPQPPDTPDEGYAIDIPLDVDQLEPYINRVGPTRLAFITGRDANPNSVLPPLGIFGGLEVTASPVPDDQVNVAAGTYQIAGTTYVAGTFTFAITQEDDANQILSPGESYQFAVVIDASGTPQVVKGLKATTPQRPSTPEGGLVLSWVQCLHQGGGITIIQDTDISGFNTQRPFSGGDPAELRSDLSNVFLRETVDSGTRLILTFTKQVVVE